MKSKQTYLILQHPGHNRVFYKQSGHLALAELRIASKMMDADCDEINIIDIEDIRYLSIITKEEISEGDLQLLSRLSFVFAIFRLRETDGEKCLIPLSKFSYEYVDSKISSILKYQGKTNELFTKMMINVALLSSDFNFNDKIQLLDPVAGKGTSLFEGIIYGFDVWGIEIEAKSVHAASVFFKKFLETERYKHRSNNRQIYGKNKSEAVYIQEFEYAKSKEQFQSDEFRKKLGMITGNTQDASKYFKRENFHLIVGDLPYGISHGNTMGKRSGSPTRNPSVLLGECLPQWHQVLKTGGIVLVAWNSFVEPKKN